jgi:2-polyprenyl-3-methyl-5-hydroxy-6-metoxy-1,4-benzoquinol methylase
MWQAAECPLCAARDRDLVLEAIVRCTACGLAYTSPRPSSQSIDRLYPDDYAPYRERPASRHSPFLKLLPAPPGGRLLDFGCGAGSLVQALARRGWRVTGIDRSPRMVERLRRLGLHAVVGTLPHPELPPASFDAITMAESLEHVHDPVGILREAHRLLRADGKLVVSVPNIAGLPFSWFGSDWIGLDVPRHLTHFEPQTLERMLTHAGFGIERILSIRHNSWLRRSARSATRAPLWCRVMRYRFPASLAGWYSTARGRANGMLAVAVRGT